MRAKNIEMRKLQKLKFWKDEKSFGTSIFFTACITVVWSLPPNFLPISGKDLEVMDFAKYIAICLGLATERDLLGECISVILIL